MAMNKNITHHQHEQQTNVLTFAIQRNSDCKNIRLRGQHFKLRRVAGREAIRVVDYRNRQFGDLCLAPIKILCPIFDNIECMPFTVSEAIVTEEVHPGTTRAHRDSPDYASLNVSFTNKPTVQASIVFKELEHLFKAKYWKPVTDTKRKSLGVVEDIGNNKKRRH